MKFKTMAGAITISLFSLPALATGPYINIGGGVVGPGKTISLSYKKLLDGVDYKALCIIDANNSHKSKSTYIKLSGSSDTVYKYNGKKVNGNDQLKVDSKVINVFQMFHIKRSMAGLRMQNLDAKQPIWVNECYATQSSDNG